jgi:hypothetical protein
MQTKQKWHRRLTYGIILVLGVIVIANQFLAIQMMKMMVMPSAYALELTGDPNVDAQLLMFPEGTPEIYGDELGITYPDPRNGKYMDQMLKILEDYDRGKRKITLTGDNLQRYIKLGTIPTIACEFCCSVKVLIFKDGKPACGCVHSAAMRGLMAYLIQNHGSEYTDEEILNEVIKWKALTFPKQMMKRYVEQAATGEFTPDISALLVNTNISNRAKKNAPSPLDVTNLPDMAGGC